MSGHNRQKAWKHGQWGETLGAIYLRLKGYAILERQYRTPAGEIDIIARRGNTLVFVEVKTRPTQEAASFAISRNQQERIMRAASLFIQSKSDAAKLDIRFDALLVSPWRLPVHLKNAWHE